MCGWVVGWGGVGGWGGEGWVGRGEEGSGEIKAEINVQKIQRGTSQMIYHCGGEPE